MESTMLTYRTLLYKLSLCLAVLMPDVVLAVAPDECEQQRSQYPKEWNDVSNEVPVFTCTSHYGGPITIMLGQPDEAGRRPMTLVRQNKESQDGKSGEVYRIWLDKEQVRRLQEGKYFGTILRQQESCWIRGSLAGDSKDDTVFFMDNADPVADGTRDGAGSFYNKAPRFSVFQGDAYDCTRKK
jgi:hypothetical protein